MKLHIGQRVKLKADENEGWNEEHGEYLGRSGGALMVRVDAPYRNGHTDDGLREVTEDQILDVERTRACAVSAHPGTSPTGFQCVLPHGHDGDHDYGPAHREHMEKHKRPLTSR